MMRMQFLMIIVVFIHIIFFKPRGSTTGFYPGLPLDLSKNVFHKGKTKKSQHFKCPPRLQRGGGGGSGYIGGVTNSPETIAGNATMPDPDGGTMTGREGNGVIIISW